jgi:hypothetical protein
MLLADLVRSVRTRGRVALLETPHPAVELRGVPGGVP